MPAPPEPPIGTWVRDRHGAVSKRFRLGEMSGWATPGCLPLAQWEPMWEARGPLIVCGPWGEEITMDEIHNMDEAADFADLTDDEIRGWSTAKLRQVAEDHSTEDSFIREILAVLPLTEREINSGGTLALLDRVVQEFKWLYADRGAKIVKRYDSVAVTIFKVDEELIQHLIFVRDAQRQLRDE